MKSNKTGFRSATETDRRKILKASCSSGLAVIGASKLLTGTVAAEDDSLDEFAKSAREGDFERAKRIAQESGIEYHRNTTQTDQVASGSNGSTDNVSTQTYFEKPGPGEIDLIFGSDNKEAWVTLSWELYPADSLGGDGPMPKDACVIAWEDSQWGLTSLDNVYAQSEAEHESPDGSVETDSPPWIWRAGD